MREMRAFDLTGRTALITGGGSGIGKGCAKILADAGANVFVIGRRESKLQEVCEEIQGQDGICDYYAADLSREENCEAMVQACVKRFGPLGVRVNTIYPGFIVTEMTEKIHEMPEQEKRMRDESPLGLLGEVEDIGYCALYLASDAAKFVTGQDFVIDGGATC